MQVGSPTVKINGKAAARHGDTVMTCNDPADQPVGKIVAVGDGEHRMTSPGPAGTDARRRTSWPRLVVPRRGRRRHGRIALTGSDDSIRQSIRSILSTAPGERVMRPDFGCAVPDLVFAVNDAATAAEVAAAVREALAIWEPRIDVIDVVATPGAATAGPDAAEVLLVADRLRGPGDEQPLQPRLPLLPGVTSASSDGTGRSTPASRDQLVAETEELAQALRPGGGPPTAGPTPARP